eukprot:TRINITY_DN55768_c0_g1_i1.p1 TRINITY_DN55768_c0_g1~~TRINITY_DN55768_c0_g1_i1.p1  ORF type:complete len:358 (-),score=51.16 TRINITY_DN55768_c0_g1_i1:77-1150(-)
MEGQHADESSAIASPNGDARVLPLLFKRNCVSIESPDAQGGAVDGVRVRNTFIDDWASSEKDEHAARQRCQTSPACLPDASEDLHGVRNAKQCTSAEPSTPEPPDGEDESTSCGSPLLSTASIRGSAALPFFGNDFAGVSDISVKNTCVHFDEPVQAESKQRSQTCCLELDDPSAFADDDDDMRDDVAQHIDFPSTPTTPCLPPSLSWQAFATISPLSCEPLPPAMVDGEALLAEGAEVEIAGLTQLPGFNGLGGVVLSWDAERGRYLVQVREPEGGTVRSVLVKRDNLKLGIKPPPAYSPRVSLSAATEACNSPVAFSQSNFVNSPNSYSDATSQDAMSYQYWPPYFLPAHASCPR